MTKISYLFQRNIICTTLGVFICLTLLRTCSTRNYFSNLDLSSQTLNPAVTGFKITGDAALDLFGSSMSTAGDINNDGYDDIIIGAYRKNGGQGAVYVIYGGQESSLLNLDLNTTTLNPLTTGFMITGNAANENLGPSVSTAGDIDNDGYDDIIIGAHQKNTAYVIYGGPKSLMSNIALNSTTLNPSTTGFMITGSATNDYLGSSVCTAGDINNDGYDDIIVGAYGRNSFQGAAYVIYGGPKSIMSNIALSSTTLNPLTTGFTISGNAAKDYFGFSVSTAGDMNNDGYNDIIVGAYVKNNVQGAAYVIYGGPKSNMSNVALNSTTLNPLTTGFMLTGNAAYDSFGYSVSTAGDINNDGYDDIIVGAFNKSSTQGAAYVIYGGPKSAMSNIALSSTLLNPLTTGFILTGNAINDQFGRSVSTAGDINGDEYDDIIVGAFKKNIVYVIYGGPKSTMSNIALSSTTLNPLTTGFTITGNAVGDYFGFAISTAGDMNNDGFDDIIVGAYLKNNAQGVAYVIYASCSSNCKQCSSESICTECKNPYLLYQSECVASCPEGTLLTSPTTCEDCPSDCKHCSSTSVCTECKSSYFMYQSECFASCPDATFANTPTACQNCPADCKHCSSASVCTECQSSYLMYQSECFAACPDATFASSATTCQDCPPDCKHCSSGSVCTECQSSYLMYQSECFATCPEGTLATSSTTCEDCPAHCNKCSSTSVCTECESSYLMYSSECFATCPEATIATSATTCQDCPADCKHCSSTSVCTECKNSHLMYQSECFASCPETTFASSTTTCEDCSDNCDHCSSASVCTECKNSYLMYQSECFASCPEGTLATSPTTCEDCPSNCKHCSSTSVCTECQNSYLMYQAECFASCPETTFASSTTTCEDCSPHCNHCSSSSVCTECRNSYFMYQFECFASCPDATFASSTTTCQDCSADCKQCSSGSVCIECQNSYLMYQSECFATCPDTTFSSSATTCQDCPADCKQCSSESVCTECESSYLMYNSECFTTCPEATFASTATTCEDCPTNCHHCSSSSACTECKDSHLMYQSECFASCPDATFASSTTTCQDCPADCKQCSSESVCTECQSSYLMYQSECFSFCPEATLATSPTTCEDCPSDCKHCSSSSVCIECQSSYFVYNSKCFSSCPEATTATPSNTCEDCPAHCNHCSSESICTECQDSYILYQDKCIDSCPDRMFLSTTTCEDCSTNCNHCTSDSICTECISPFALYESQCLTSCPKGMFNSDNVCKDCPSYCSSCTSQDSCQVCYEGFTLSSSSLCVAPVSGPAEPIPSSSYQEVQNEAIQRISAAAKGISSVVSVGRVVTPFAMLASKTVQNTRYLNLSVTDDLSEVYQTWNKDLISWEVPNSFSNNEDNFEPSPPLFARYGTGSPFLVNFWPTFINITGGLAIFITFFLLQRLLEKSKYEGWASLVQKLVAGSFNFTLIQAYVCLDDVLFYIVLDIKTNPLNSFFSCASLICALVFSVFACLLVLFNLWTIKKYQKTKKQGPKDIEVFNKKNKYWKLFYSDCNDNDLWCQSFFAILLIRSTLSSLIIAAFYDYPLMQTLTLLAMDVFIISFLYVKTPFKTLLGKLAQYFYEITTLLVHLCTFSLSLKPSHTPKAIFSTAIIYLNTALIMGAVCFMFFEIYKTISEMRKARLKRRQVLPVENQEIQNLTQSKSPLHAPETDDRKRPEWAHQDQTGSVGTFHLLPEATTPNGDMESPIRILPSRAQNRRQLKKVPYLK